MKKVIVSMVSCAFVVSVAFCDNLAAEQTGDANQTSSGINFKGFASKTYNFLGIQTKEDNQKAFETIAKDLNTIKIEQKEYMKQVSKILEEYKLSIETLKKENLALKESNEIFKKDMLASFEKASNEVKQLSSIASSKQNISDAKLQDEKLSELSKELSDAKAELKFLKNLLNQMLESKKPENTSK